MADAGYGDCAQFRQGLDDRQLSYVVGVASSHTAFAEDVQRSAPPYKGAGRRPPPIYREKAPSIKTLVLAAGQSRTRQVVWREGSRRRDGKPVKMRSRFVFLRVRPAGKVHRRAAIPSKPRMNTSLTQSSASARLGRRKSRPGRHR